MPLAPPLSVERLGGPAPDRISVDDALERIAGAFAPLGEHERVPAIEAIGRVLVEDVPADMDIPPFTNCAVDGYAVAAADVAMAAGDHAVQLRVLGEVAAGEVPPRAATRGETYRVLTGAPLPDGTDGIVPYEDTDGAGFGGWQRASAAPVAEAERSVRVFRGVGPGDNVRYVGEDQRKGEIILRAGTPLRPAEIGALASLGRTEVWVHRRPRVGILSTGDELTPPAEPLTPGHIRDANSQSLAAYVRHHGGEPLSLGIARDDKETVRARLLDAIARGADLLLTSGGVSLGDRDVVKEVLREEGEIAFWSIDIRPGRPLTFGTLRGVPILALPGNPVAVMVTFELFVRAALLRLAGHTRWRKVEMYATALQAISNRSGRENFMRAVVEQRWADGGEPEWTARLTGEQGSGIITSMVKANALVRLMRGQTRISAGERVRVVMLDWPPL